MMPGVVARPIPAPVNMPRLTNRVWRLGITELRVTPDIVLPEGDTSKCKEGAHGRHIATVEPLSAGVNILPEFSYQNAYILNLLSF